MNKTVIKEDIKPNIEELMNLYNSVGWSAYTEDKETLKNAIENSLKVYTAWNKDMLVGLARVVGDNYTIIYIQDILVLESYQDQGIGSKLLKLVLEEYKSIRQIALLTDDTEKTISFYQKNGMVKVSDYDGVAFMK